MGLFRRSSNRQVEEMIETLRRIAPELGVSAAIVDGQTCVSFPPEMSSFSYLIPRNSVWGLFEGLEDPTTWGYLPPTLIVVGRIGDDMDEIARSAITWHGKSSLDKIEFRIPQ